MLDRPAVPVRRGVVRPVASGWANPASARKQRLRRRQRQGLIVVQCEVSSELIDMLIDLGWLRIDESEDRAEIAAAIMAALGSARPLGAK